MSEQSLLVPDWELPEGVAAFVTTRIGGHSVGKWQSFNLGLHVQDAQDSVQQNREELTRLLLQHTGLEDIQVQWLQQVHGTDVHLPLGAFATEPPPRADAIYTRQSGLACAVLTADCLPVLFCSQDGGEIAVAHAGWRGLVAGVLEATLAKFSARPQDIRVWLGPAIGPCHFEVGAEVRQAFLAAAATEDLQATTAAFVATAKPGKYLADLYRLARIRLGAAGVSRISGRVQCTVCETDAWYSYRRSAETGRFATLIVRTH